MAKCTRCQLTRCSCHRNRACCIGSSCFAHLGRPHKPDHAAVLLCSGCRTCFAAGSLPRCCRRCCCRCCCRERHCRSKRPAPRSHGCQPRKRRQRQRRRKCWHTSAIAATALPGRTRATVSINTAQYTKQKAAERTERATGLLPSRWGARIGALLLHTHMFLSDACLVLPATQRKTRCSPCAESALRSL
jgi:hypothetical protein